MNRGIIFRFFMIVYCSKIITKNWSCVLNWFEISFRGSNTYEKGIGNKIT